MPTRRNDINAVLAEADEQLQSIEADYARALREKKIPTRLPVRIKNYLENLRSSLDYVATDISENVLGRTSSERSYFPIGCRTPAEFWSHLQRNLPCLKERNPSLCAVLEGIQPYGSGALQALPKLSKLVNESKHERLSPQTRRESRSLSVEFPGGSNIMIGPGSFISGHGVISSGGAKVRLQGDTISPETPAQRVSGGVKQTVIVWVSLRFDGIGDDILSLLRSCRDEVTQAIDRLSPHLWA